jgi:aminopeptidase N
MLIMDGSASEGLIVHEIVHQYAHGMLANNEWEDGWLDEGLTSFLTNWYWEETGRPEREVWQTTMESLREMERAGRTQPVALPDAAFVDFPTYIAMAYRKPAVVFRMLRWMVGEEQMLNIMRTYYERNKLSHVDEGDLREAVNLATGRDFDWFFEQWIHTTNTLDYTVLGARTRQLADGRWRTEVDVYRMGEAWMPVTLQVGDETLLLESRDRRQRVEVITRERPEEAVLDPEDVLLDIDPTNNRRSVREM